MTIMKYLIYSSILTLIIACSHAEISESEFLRKLIYCDHFGLNISLNIKSGNFSGRVVTNLTALESYLLQTNRRFIDFSVKDIKDTLFSLIRNNDTLMIEQNLMLDDSVHHSGVGIFRVYDYPDIDSIYALGREKFMEHYLIEKQGYYIFNRKQVIKNRVGSADYNGSLSLEHAVINKLVSFKLYPIYHGYTGDLWVYEHDPLCFNYLKNR